MNKHKNFIKECYDGKYGNMCADWKVIIENHYPVFKEEQFKVGDWVYSLDYWPSSGANKVFRIRKIQGRYVYMDYEDSSQLHADSNQEIEQLRKATKEEIQSHLIAEAKRRGFKEGVTFVNSFNNRTTTSQHGKFSYLDSGELVIDGSTIYNTSGKWAEILETITKEEAEKLLGKKIV